MKHPTKRAWTKYGLVALVTALIVAPTAAIASHGFTDVPDDNIFHNNIQWMKDSGVTLGCNPPTNDKYCPNNTVTRGQMAAFMQRLAENKVVDAATAGDSELLDGSDGTFYESPAAGWANPTAIVLPSDSNETLAEISISAPTAGGILITSNASFNDSSDAAIVVWIQVDDTTCVNTPAIAGQVYGYTSTNVTNRWMSASLSVVESVTTGNHTVTFCGREFGEGTSTVMLSPSLTAIFSADALATILAVPAAAEPLPGQK